MIEQAALQYSMNESGLDYIGELACENGFIAGAEWRINSVWHKPSAYGEELMKNVKVIVKTKNNFYRFGKFDIVDYSKKYIGFVSTTSHEYALSEILEYAYLDDLLPGRKD